MECIQLKVPFDSPFDSPFEAFRHDVYTCGVQIKYVEADLQEEPGWLSRRLSDNPEDKMAGAIRLKDAERILDVIHRRTGRAPRALIDHFINKYVREQQADDARAAGEFRAMLPDLKRIIAVMERADSVPGKGKKP